MCYDISFTVQIKELSDYFPDLIFDEQIEMDFTPVHIIGHAYGNHPVVYRNRDSGKLHCRLMEWGCIPFYIKDETAFKKQRATMLNARSEKILSDKKSYWNKIRNRRCLVPVTGFYEHREVQGFKNKIPYFINKKDEGLFFFPALYSVAELPDETTGEVLSRFTFTIITREANALMAQIHNGGTNKGRMPLMLDKAFTDLWLKDDLADEEYEEILAYSLQPEALDFTPVFSVRTNKEREDGKEKNEYFQWDGLPEIIL